LAASLLVQWQMSQSRSIAMQSLGLSREWNGQYVLSLQVELHYHDPKNYLHDNI